MHNIVSWAKKHIMDVLIWGLIFFFFILYVSLLFNYNIWTDEAFTLKLLRGSFKDIIEGTAKDVHPPLYYLYGKIFFDITGESLWVQKFLTIIPQVGTYALIATAFRKRFGDVATFLTLVFFTCIPCTMEFTVQIRMYSLALFFVTLCGIYAYEAYMDNKKKDWVWVIIGALGAAYSHYFAFVSVIVIVGFLFLAILFTKRELFKNWLISAGCMLAGYLPWAGIFYEQVTRVRENYWIEEITPKVIFEYFEWTFDLELLPGTMYGIIALLVLAGVIMLIHLVAKREKEDIIALIAMLIPTMTTVLGVVISLRKSPIYRDQYVFPALMFLAIYFGLALRKTNWKKLVFVCAFFLVVGAVQYKECFRQEYRSTLVPQTMEFFEENLSPDDYVIYDWEAFGFIYANYFPKEQLVYVEEFDFSKNFNAVWLLNTATTPQIPEDILKNNGLTMDIIGTYGIEHNVFDIYMIYRSDY